MNERQLTDDEFNAIVERVSSGEVNPHDQLQAVLREVRYQLRAQPPVQIGTSSSASAPPAMPAIPTSNGQIRALRS